MQVVGSDPYQGRVGSEVLDVHPNAGEGSVSGQSAHDFNELKLKKKVLTAYLSALLSATELQLVNNVWSRFKGLRPNNKKCNVVLHLRQSLILWNREEDLKECLPKLVPNSLINVIPKAESRDNSGKYSIGNLVMDMFMELLQRRQHTYPKLCWMSDFLKHHTSVILHNEARIVGMIWDSFKPTP
ncbi:hypothetical protein Cgig2_023132 [Carnegiea gigantea]|uniref:Uncharacterized protein n=1 Tax=Carnegiea gigantea TaxID=171969 RepID=A0A9Q1JRJ6_9CARY|nr:hypothetical protein Cgig2_023132 [Carnegiea gigantea]